MKLIPARSFGAKAKAGGGPPAAAAPVQTAPKLKTNFEEMIEEGGVG